MAKDRQATEEEKKMYLKWKESDDYTKGALHMDSAAGLMVGEQEYDEDGNPIEK